MKTKRILKSMLAVILAAFMLASCAASETEIPETAATDSAIAVSEAVPEITTANTEATTATVATTAVTTAAPVIATANLTTTNPPVTTAAFTTTDPSEPPIEAEYNSEYKEFLDTESEYLKDFTLTNKSYGSIKYIETYRSDGVKKPIMFILHGGGGKKEHYMGYLEDYAGEGFYVVAIDAAAHGESDRGPMANLDIYVETVGYIDSLLDLYEDSNEADASRFGIQGESMGASIALLYGVLGERTPSVLLPLGGAPDYTKILNSRANGITDKGKSVGEEEVTPELIQKALELSAISHVEKFVDIPMWAVFGAEDIDGGIEGVIEFKKLLSDAGGTIQELIIVEGGGHGGFDQSYYETKMPYIKKYMGMS